MICDKFSYFWKFGFEHLNRLTRKRIMIPERLASLHTQNPIPRYGEAQRFQDSINCLVRHSKNVKFFNYRQKEMMEVAEARNVFNNVYKRIVLRHKYFGTDSNSDLLKKVATQVVFFSNSSLRKRFFSFGQRHNIDQVEIQNAINVIVAGNGNVRFNGKFPVRCQLENTNKPCLPPAIARYSYSTVKTNAIKDGWELPDWFLEKDPNKTIMVNGCASHTKEILNDWIRTKSKYKFNLRQHTSAIMKHFNWWGLSYLPNFRVDPENLKYLTFNPSKKLDDFTTKFVGLGKLPPPRKGGYSPKTVISPVVIFSHVIQNLKTIMNNKRLPSFGINFPGGREKDDDLAPNAETLKTRFVAQSITGFQATANFFMLPVKALLKHAKGCFPSNYNNSKGQFLSQLALHVNSKSELEGDYKRGEASWGWKNKLVATAFMFSFYHLDSITLRAFEFTLDFELECLKIFGQRLIHELDTGLMSGKGDMGLKWSLQQFFLHSFEYTYFLKKKCGVNSLDEYFPSFFGDDMKHHFSKAIDIIPSELEEWYRTNTGFNLLGVKYKENLPGISNKVSFLATHFTDSGFPSYMPSRWATICLLCRPFEKLGRRKNTLRRSLRLFDSIVSNYNGQIYDKNQLRNVIRSYGYSVFNVAMSSLRSGLVINGDHLMVIVYLFIVAKEEGYISNKHSFYRFFEDILMESERYKIEQGGKALILSDAKSGGIWNPRESNAKSTYYDICVRFGYIPEKCKNLLDYGFKRLRNFSRTRNLDWRRKVDLYLSIYSKFNSFGLKKREIASTLGTFRTINERRLRMKLVWRIYCIVGELRFYKVFDCLNHRFDPNDRRFIIITEVKVDETPSSFDYEIPGDPYNIVDLDGQSFGSVKLGSDINYENVKLWEG